MTLEKNAFCWIGPLVTSYCQLDIQTSEAVSPLWLLAPMVLLTHTELPVPCLVPVDIPSVLFPLDLHMHWGFNL